MAQSATIDIVIQPSFLDRKARDFQTIALRIAVGFEAVLENHPQFSWVVYSLLYFAWAATISMHKQLWFDELVSYSVDHVLTWADAWRALQLGVDANPPLFHLVNRLLLAVLGDTDLVQRGSSILGFWVMSLCVYLVVRRNHSAAAAWVGALLPACSGAAYYATEARPYGMVLAFSSFAILCWVQLADGSAQRRWWLVGLSLSLACAVSSHYYSVFIIVPFIGAELSRAAKRSRVHWPIVIAVLASYWPLAIFYPAGLMSAATQYTGSTDNVSFMLPFHFWPYVTGPAIGSAIVLAVLLMSWSWIEGHVSVVVLEPNPALLAAAWFCILPVIVVIGARYATHAYEARYALAAILGLAILLASAADVLRGLFPGAAGLAILSLLLPISVDAVGGRNKPRGRHTNFAWAAATLEHPEFPVVYGMPLESVQAWHYAPTGELKRRITCLVDVRESLKRTHTLTADLGVINLKPALPAPSLDYQKFADQKMPFYFIHQPSVESWVAEKLVEDGAELRLKGMFGGVQLYLVTWSPAETGPLHRPKT